MPALGAAVFAGAEVVAASRADVVAHLGPLSAHSEKVAHPDRGQYCECRDDGEQREDDGSVDVLAVWAYRPATLVVLESESAQRVIGSTMLARTKVGRVSAVPTIFVLPPGAGNSVSRAEDRIALP